MKEHRKRAEKEEVKLDAERSRRKVEDGGCGRDGVESRVAPYFQVRMSCTRCQRTHTHCY